MPEGLVGQREMGFRRRLGARVGQGYVQAGIGGVISRDISSNYRYRCACVPLLGKLGVVLIGAVHN